MVKSKYYILLIVILLLPIYGYGVATGVDFLKLGVGGRATGMGEAFVAIHSGIMSSFWNPAGTAEIEKPELGFMHSEAVVDATLQYVGFAYPYDNYGIFSIGALIYMIKPIPVTTGTGQTLGDLNWMDAAYILSYSKKINEQISCGINGKIIHRTESDPIFGSAEGSTYALDLGAIYNTPIEALNVGYSMLNNGGKLKMSGEKKEDDLPQSTRLGVSYNYLVDVETSILFSGDIYRILYGDWRISIGAELNYSKMILIRAGYFSKEGNIAGTTYGFGFKMDKFQIDYSNVPASEMVGYERNNKVSLTIQF